MAGLKVTFDDQGMEKFRKFVKSFPELTLRFLSDIGKKGRSAMERDVYGPNTVDLKAYPRDKRGRFTITSKVNRRHTGVDIRSYPANLFEKGRRLRDGSRAPGQFLITGGLKGIMAAKMQLMADESSRSILGKEMNKV
jgi:hypothetical protein